MLYKGEGERMRQVTGRERPKSAHDSNNRIATVTVVTHTQQQRGPNAALAERGGAPTVAE